MTQRKRTPIFFSYSFDKTPPSWSGVSDHEVAQWFEKLLKAKFTVLSGNKAQSRPIADKIFDAVDRSRGVVALFTGKHHLNDAPLRFLPSNWVLCECAYAQGSFRDPDYIVAGFREKGVAPLDLASITSKDMEIPEFERDHLERDKDIFVGYLRDLETRLLYGASGQPSLIPGLPYVQAALHKIVLIYQNDFCTTQNINHITIKDPDAFNHDGNQILHHMYNSKREFPSLESMMETSISQRKTAPFFYAMTEKVGNKKLGTPLRVTVDNHDGKDVFFRALTLDENEQLLKLKINDTL
ncbi:MAG: hypothetical protein HQ478_14095 [Chloroflexi bacterium]|nr:hypothetical protein [Chloroflexota bacterium]